MSRWRILEKCRIEVCRDIGRLYADMIFLDGYVHCDPHPGNVLVQLIPGTRRHKIVLLDHGLYTTLDPEFRYNYAQLWMSIISADLDGIKQWSQKLNVGDLYGLFACMITARSWQSITHGVANADRSSAENEEISLYISSLLPQISDVIDRVPRPMILLLKTNDLIRSIEHNLKTESASAGLLQMSAVCVTAIRDTRLPSLTHWHQRLALRLWALYHLTRLTLLATALRIYSAARLTA